MERVKDSGTSVLLIGRGDCHLGRTRTDEAGNVVEQTGAKWEPNAEGGCVATAISSHTSRRGVR